MFLSCRLRIAIFVACLGLTGVFQHTARADQPLPTISINDVSISEASCQGKSFVFTVTLSRLSDKTVTVNYATSDGTPDEVGTAAVANNDYVPVSGTLTFTHRTPPNGPKGSYRLTITVPLGNYVVSSGSNDRRAFTVTLSGAANALISKSQGVGTLLDAASSCTPAQNAGCFVNYCGANTACKNANHSTTLTPYCTLAGLGNTPQPDPAFGECNDAGLWVDSDGDGFSDAAERQGYIDVNGNGVYDSGVDVPLPGADPNKVDVYLHYDYVAASDHDHNPPPQAIQWIVDAFAAHGANLHIDPQHNAIDESTVKVVTQDFLTRGAPDYLPTLECSGPSAASMHQLRQRYFASPNNLVYHYMVFSHWSSCDSVEDCVRCAPDPECGGGTPPFFGALGSAEINGDDAIVSLGPLVDVGIPVPLETWAGVTMHELGHNLGLFHGGPSCDNYKPNYLSVMNYSFDTTGIPVGGTPGDTMPKTCATDADCPAPAHCSGPNGFIPNTCFRIDYSSAALADLNEFAPSSSIGGLDETKGLNVSPTSTDISVFTTTGFNLIYVPTNGAPIDWNQNGIIETHVTQDINNDFGATTLLTGSNDWAASNGLFTNLNFDFQCTNHFVDDASAPVLMSSVSRSGFPTPGALPHTAAAGPLFQGPQPKRALQETMWQGSARAIMSTAGPTEPRATNSATISSAVTLSPASINFNYQLVGTPSAQLVETVTNSSTTPIVITDISVSGRDRRDFIPTYSFTLPVTLAPGNAIAINLSFAPALPWRAGTRNARLEVSEKKNSQYVTLTGIGATCGGPLPACSSGCADADGDGLNDAWEIAGGIDLDNDGKIDSQNDTLLSRADPNKPDIYVHYDWMDYGGLDFPCSADFDCPQFGNSAGGTATCTGPKIASSSLPRSCVQLCNIDADCQALAIPGNGGDSHAFDRCIANVCQHTHDPELITPGAIQAVVNRFASRGFNLHVIRGQALPHSHVLTLRTLNQMTDGCEGGSVASGTAGAGDYAESYFDLKAKYFDPRKSLAYHHTIFSHYSQCDTFEHCADDAHKGSCPSGTARVGLAGYSEINGNDFIVSLGNLINDFEAFLTPGPPGSMTFGQLIAGGTFMHELGHDLGLRHGGGVSATPDPTSCFPPACEDEPNAKPNFLSVMNYRYQLDGIQSASAPGEFIPVDTRLDYSTQLLPTVPISNGIVGVLDELGLDETVGYGLTSGNSDLFSFTDGKCIGRQWPTHAPVDWDGSGVAGDNPAAVADLNSQENFAGECFAPSQKHRGLVEWGPAPGQSIFRYAFQCTSFFADGLGVTPIESLPPDELTTQIVREAHALYPTRPVTIAVTPGREEKVIAPGRGGEFSVALIGSADFDVRKVEPTSLRFHGAVALSTELRDINGDGKLDLLIVFDQASVRLDPQAKTARLTGWLKNSQAFIGEDRITIAR